MQLVVELELWSAPGSLQHLSSGKALAEKCRTELFLPASVVPGLSFVPSITDVENLRSSFQAGELSEAAFSSFCARVTLPSNPSHPESAARFLAFSYGQSLAWLHFPSTEAGIQMCRKVVQWARHEGLSVVEPSSIFCLAGESGVALCWPAAA